MFLSRNIKKKISEFLSEFLFFFFLEVKFSIYLNRRVFVMGGYCTDRLMDTSEDY